MADKYTRIANGTLCQKIAPKGLFTGLKNTFLQYCTTLILLPLLALVVIVAPLLTNTQSASAASNSTMNFQARLLLASGALVPDGFYSVEFKLYDSLNSGGTGQGVCSLNSTTDDCWWLETRTGANTVRVVNGYVAVNLGSVTPFGASIPWDQDLYVTMRVGGIGAPVWDTTEMTNSGNRMKISAVTYAFRSAVLMNSTNTVGFNADQIVQLGPTATQAVSSAGAAINVNQTGAGTLLDLRAGGTSKLTVDASGNTAISGTVAISGLSTVQGSVIASGSATGTTGTAVATPGTNTTTVSLTAAGTFANNDVIFVNNAGQDYYTRIVSGGGTTTLTVSPAVSYDASAPITKYTIQNIGATSTDYTTLSNRFYQGYFLGGIVVGTGSTTLSDGNLSRTVGDITIQPGTGGAVQILGSLNVTAISGDGSGLTNLNSSSITGSTLTGLNASNISSGTLADLRLSSNVGLLNLSQTFSALKTFGAGATITAGQAFTVNGDAFTDLTGTGLQITGGALNVIYGSTAGTAVQGNVTLTCPSGSGNLTGGGTSITLGTGGTCGAISTNNAVSFSTSVTTPSLTSSAGLAISSTGANTITLDTGGSAAVTIAGTFANALAIGRNGITTTINGTTIVLGASTIRHTAAGTTNFELNDIANTTLDINNTDATATASLSIEGSVTAASIVGSGTGITALNATNVASGTLADARLTGNIATLTGTQTFSGPKTFGAGTVVTAGQTITINGDAFTDLTGTGLAISSGVLGIDTAYFNANYIQLGAASAQSDSSTNSSIGINKTGASGNILTLQKSAANVFVVGNSGALTISATSTGALDIQTAGNVSTFAVDTSGNIVRVGASAADSIGVIFVLDTKNTSGDPTGTAGAQYYNSATGTFRCYENGRGWTDCIGVPKPNTRRSTEFLANGTTAALTSDGGDTSTTTGTITAAAAGTAPANPAAVNYATNNGTNSDAGTSGNANFNTAFNPSMQAHVTLTTSVASTRAWVGYTNQTLVTMDGSANPAGIYAAFRYDTSAGDANWQCITKNGGAQTINNSGVAASTSAVKMEVIIVDGVKVEFKINGVLVCTNVATLPATSTLMRHVVSRRNLAAGAQNLRVGWVYMDSDQ